MFYNLLWYPPKSSIQVWDINAERELPLHFNGKNVDFYDTIMASGIAFGSLFGIYWKTASANWKHWDAEAVERINSLLNYDFNFEGLEVKIEFVSEYGEPAYEWAKWKMSVVGPMDQEAEAD